MRHRNIQRVEGEFIRVRKNDVSLPQFSFSLLCSALGALGGWNMGGSIVNQTFDVTAPFDRYEGNDVGLSAGAGVGFLLGWRLWQLGVWYQSKYHTVARHALRDPFFTSNPVRSVSGWPLWTDMQLLVESLALMGMSIAVGLGFEAITNDYKAYYLRLDDDLFEEHRSDLIAWLVLLAVTQVNLFLTASVAPIRLKLHNGAHLGRQITDWDHGHPSVTPTLGRDDYINVTCFQRPSYAYLMIAFSISGLVAMGYAFPKGTHYAEEQFENKEMAQYDGGMVAALTTFGALLQAFALLHRGWQWGMWNKQHPEIRAQIDAQLAEPPRPFMPDFCLLLQRIESPQRTALMNVSKDISASVAAVLAACGIVSLVLAGVANMEPVNDKDQKYQSITAFIVLMNVVGMMATLRLDDPSFTLLGYSAFTTDRALRAESAIINADDEYDIEQLVEQDRRSNESSLEGLTEHRISSHFR